jgi:hypothetical protein
MVIRTGARVTSSRVASRTKVTVIVSVVIVLITLFWPARGEPDGIYDYPSLGASGVSCVQFKAGRVRLITSGRRLEMGTYDLVDDEWYWWNTGGNRFRIEATLLYLRIYDESGKEVHQSPLRRVFFPSKDISG